MHGRNREGIGVERTKAEAMRYLGARGKISGEADGILDECMALMREAARARHVRAEYQLDFSAGGLVLAGTGICLAGNDIAAHMRGCKSAAVMAATLGAAADSLIRRFEAADLTRAVVLDACASAIIEEYCDEIEAGVKTAAGEAGLKTAARFSPGYGDFPLDTQPQILSLLDTYRKIGLGCDGNFLLSPRKSVTAVIGIGKNPDRINRGCDTCAMRGTCLYIAV